MEKSRKSICSSVRFSLTIVDSKMISRELLGPSDLARPQALRINELTEVIVVGKDKNFVFAAF